MGPTRSFGVLIILLLALASSAYALRPVPAGRMRQRALRRAQALPATAGVKLELISRGGLSLTDALKVHVDARVSKVLSKLGSRKINSAHVTLRIDGGRDVTKGPHSGAGQVAEIVCRMKGGHNIKSISSTGDMYASIDLASHQIAQNLKSYVQQLKDHKGRTRESLGGHVAEDEVDEDKALLDFDEESLLVNLNPIYRK